MRPDRGFYLEFEELEIMNIFDRIRFGIFNVQMVATRKCNLSCGYCDEWDKTSKPVGKDQLIEQIDHLAKLGLFSVVFTGGEPLLNPDLMDVIRYATKKVGWVGLISNGYLINEKIVRKFNALGINGLQLSIDGVNPSKMTVKVMKYLLPKLEMLSRLAKFPVNINAVIGSTNPEEALEVLRTARRLKLKSTIGLIHNNRGQLKLNSNQREVYREAARMIDKPWWARRSFEERLIKFGEDDFKCRSGCRYLYVDEFGMARFCSQQKDLYQKPVRELTLADLKENFVSKKPCTRTCTVGCVRSASLVDWWRA
jgi:MoaA/NifB/PqqE/SkfB family radical SAM enzyme